MVVNWCGDVAKWHVHTQTEEISTKYMCEVQQYDKPNHTELQCTNLTVTGQVKRNKTEVLVSLDGDYRDFFLRPWYASICAEEAWAGRWYPPILSVPVSCASNFTATGEFDFLSFPRKTAPKQPWQCQRLGCLFGSCTSDIWGNFKLYL